MKIIAKTVLGSCFAMIAAGAMVANCGAGLETRDKIKDDTKAAMEKTKEAAKEIVTDTKELARKGG